MNTLSTYDSSEFVYHSGKLWISCKYEILSTTWPTPLCNSSPSSTSLSSESSDKFLSHQTLNSSSSINLITSSALKSFATHLFFTPLGSCSIVGHIGCFVIFCRGVPTIPAWNSQQQRGTVFSLMNINTGDVLTFWLVHNGIPLAKSRSRKIRWMTQTCIYVAEKTGSCFFRRIYTSEGTLKLKAQLFNASGGQEQRQEGKCHLAYADDG